MRSDLYIIPFDELKRLVGSKDRQTLETIRVEQAEILSDADIHLEPNAPANCADALADLIDGKDFTSGVSPRDLFRYRFALEALWAHAGEYAGEVGCESTADLDDALTELGVPLKFAALVSGDAVVPLPEWDDLPCVGSWSPAQVVAALPAVEEIDPDDLDLDDELAENLEPILDAIRDAGTRPGWGVVAISFPS